MRFFALITAIMAGFIALAPAAAQMISAPELCQQQFEADTPRPIASDEPAIRIIAPAFGSTVYGAQFAVTVQLQNFHLNTDGNYWALWVNGDQLTQSYELDALVNLEPGPYQLCAVMTDSRAQPIGTPDVILITVEAAGEGTPAATLPAAPQTAAGAGASVDCEALLPADRPLPVGADAPAIRLVAPADGSTVYGEQIAFRVETQNFALNSEARHWHIWVNGALAGMVYQPDALLDLKPGTYKICASLGDTDHADLGMPASITITVAELQPGQPTPTLPVAPEMALVQPEPAAEPGQIILIVVIGLAAAAGGWWLGARLGKRR